MTRLSKLESWLEEIDASIFSGELLEIPEQHNMLRSYMNRWQGAIDQQRRNHWAEFTLTTALPMIKVIVQAETMHAVRMRTPFTYL